MTVEGLEVAEGELDSIQQAFIEHTGFQCSYCTPGFVLMTKALLEENPERHARRRRASTSPATCAAAAAT